MNTLRRQFVGIISITLLFLTIPLGLLTEMGVHTHIAIVPLVVLMQALILRVFKNTQSIILLSLYVFLYFLYLLPYFYGGMNLGPYTQYQRDNLYCVVAFLFYLYYLGTLLAYKCRAKDVNKRLLENYSLRIPGTKRAIFYIVFFVLLLGTLAQGQNVLVVSDGTYETYQDNLDSINSMPLYTILFLVFLYPVLNKKSKSYSLLWLFLVVILSFFCITRGLRIVLAPLFFFLFLIYLEGRIKNKILYIIMAIGYSIFILANILKMNMEFQFNMLFSEGDDSYILSHHAEILYGAAAGIGLIQDGIVSVFQRLILNITYILEIVVPPSWFPDMYKFPHIITSNTTIGGGGLCIIASFYMWGYIGVLLFGFLLTRFICNSYRSNNPVRILLCIIVLVFSPRWISYDFNNLLRFPFIGILVYYVFFKHEKKYEKNIDRV